MINENEMWDLTDIVKQEESSKDNFVSGYVINGVGQVLAKFAFEHIDNGDSIQVVINKDGFLTKAYSNEVKVIMGYGILGLGTSLVDPEKSSLVTLSPKLAQDDSIELKIDNDSFLQTNGFNIIIRVEDLDFPNMNSELAKEMVTLISEAKKETEEELSEIEESFKNYVISLHEILTNGKTNKKLQEEQN